MSFWKKQITLQSMLNFLIKAFLFLLPWQTILILKEQFFGGYKWQWGMIGLYVTEILLWVIVILFTISLWQKIKEKKNKIKFDLFSRDRLFIFSILIFVVYGLVSSFWALDSQVAWQHGLHIMEAFLFFLVIFLGPVGFSSSARYLVAGSFLVALLGIVQFYIQDSFNIKWLGLTGHDAWRVGSSIISSNDTGRWLRAYGSFNHPNIFGGYLAMSFIIYILLLYRSKQEEEWFFVRWFRKHNITKIILSYFLLVILISAIFFSFSRSALLALVIFLLVGLFLSLFEHGKFYKIRFILFSSFSILIVLGIIFWPIVHNRVTASSVYEERSVEERIDGYSHAWEMFKNHPWLGVGAGNSTLALHQLHPEVPAWNIQPVHNIFLLMLVELGMVGLFLLGLVILTFLYYQSQYYRQSLINLNLFYFNLVVAYLFLGLFDHYLFSLYIGLIISGVYWGLIVRFNQHYLHS